MTWSEFRRGCTVAALIVLSPGLAGWICHLLTGASS